jgi:uncharacterized membrane protein YqjE
VIEPPRDGTPDAGASAAGETPSPEGFLRTLAESLGTFITGKFRLLELELSRDLRDVGRAAILLALVAALLVMMILFAGAGVALLAGEAMGSPGGGFLAVAAVYMAAALVLLAAGRKRLKRLSHFLEATRADLKRDGEWLKNLP